MSNLNITKEDTTDEETALALHSLIEQQEVFPIHDLEGLSDLWPADDDPDRLLNFVLEERTERDGEKSNANNLNEHCTARYNRCKFASSEEEAQHFTC